MTKFSLSLQQQAREAARRRYLSPAALGVFLVPQLLLAFINFNGFALFGWTGTFLGFFVELVTLGAGWVFIHAAAALGSLGVVRALAAEAALKRVSGAELQFLTSEEIEAQPELAFNGLVVLSVAGATVAVLSFIGAVSGYKAMETTLDFAMVFGLIATGIAFGVTVFFGECISSCLNDGRSALKQEALKLHAEGVLSSALQRDRYETEKAFEFARKVMQTAEAEKAEAAAKQNLIATAIAAEKTGSQK